MLKITTNKQNFENIHFCAESYKDLLIKTLTANEHDIVSILEIPDNAHGLDEIISRPENVNKARAYYGFYWKR